MIYIALAFLGVLYFVPLFSLVIKPFFFSWNQTTPFGKFLLQINESLGHFEYNIRGLRNLVIGNLLMFFALFEFVQGIIQKNLGQNFVCIIVSLLLYGLTLTTKYQAILISLKMSDFLKNNPDMHPGVFFKVYHHLYGPFPYETPDPHMQETVSPLKVSFKKNQRPKQTFSLLFPALVDTTHLAHTSLRALRYVGKEYAREVFDIMANMWGKRLLELWEASMEVVGTHHVEGKHGKFILIFNHKSPLDFGLTSFALSAMLINGNRTLRPRFITAKDHFMDNPFIYKVIGVGKLIETVDMVFIERKNAKKGFQNLAQAAKLLCEKDIEIAIYPQGTRAKGNMDRSEKRRDAGYYTTVSPKDICSPLGHLKKGCAYLAVDTLIEMAKKGIEEPLYLVFVGINGTATAFAKQSLKVQTETAIVYNITRPLILTTALVSHLKKPEGIEAKNPEEEKYLELIASLHKKIDHCLVEATQIHESLKYRFLLDLKGQFHFEESKIEAIEKHLDKASQTHSTCYQILDRIYACPPQDWNGSLSEMAHLLLEDPPLKRFETLREQITLKMLGTRNKKMHGKKIERPVM
ncbi:MAG: hypothetical protein A3G32_09625 [Deltaproteobacteria bacterium RIFCSPLOWO2_12_FULL_40_28]|nr:MAG: hypothetical protein A3C45_04720 [Deltaproteobacteria bacterium RIFCSPHIGHO2_02_FULL_40_28]OGQ20218.1 MAG: hypothetical protein A3E27_06000 [Deltaproteobacteria bacterium RIFCSPHIGHO2_12_FULL_40_32]OGQ54791.1 MAG: hypothetical protein A3G32_09625 [Deltaproteobacteria bacterium RIFCSPLOWO2_12_FULL_40_28]